MRAELRAAELGLARAWELGIKKVILELDSLSAVLSIEGTTVADSRHGPIIHQIRQLRSREWQVVVRHCFREANRVADLIADCGHSQVLGTHLYDVYPLNIRSAFLSDCIGVSFPRMIHIND
ncbi:Putative ribonuclease H protein At1g65750 [Linum perenne]